MATAIPPHEIFNNPAWYKTLTLTERLALLRAQTAEPRQENIFDPEQARRRLASWKAQYPFDKESYFAERLAMDGMTEDELLALLGEASEAGQKHTLETPSWLNELAQAFESSESVDLFVPLQESNEDLQKARLWSSQSFLVAIYPLVIAGRERFKKGLATLLTAFPTPPFDPETIHRMLLDNLAKQLLWQISRTLTLELHIARMEGRLKGETPDERFRDFVQLLRSKETLLAILEEYAPLARLLMVTIDYWVSYNLEFLRHLCTDWHEICQAMELDHDPGKLVETIGGIGDVHRRGRSTLKLRFASGFQLMYKPRSLTIDTHFQQLLLWLNERGDHLAFRIIRIIDKGAYGWSEYVSSEECRTAEEVARFYERQGGYLALLYALEATDFHLENLIASGEHPVMIDLEALFHPRLAGRLSESVFEGASEMMQASVLRVGLLPHRLGGNLERAGIDVSGLGGKGGQFTPQPVLQIEAQGTEYMRFIRQYVEIPEKNNRPVLGGKRIDLLDYGDQLLLGFTKVYRLLVAHRDALLTGPLQVFARDEIRVIVRATRTYAQLLHESYHPDLLRDMLERDRFFDHLWISAEKQPHLKRLIAAERADLHAGDIPMFTTRVDTCDLFTSQGERIPDVLAETSLDRVNTRLHQLSEEDLARQSWFIQASLATMLMGTQHDNFAPSHLISTQIQAVTRKRLIQAACAVGDRLCGRALLDRHGANWLGLTYINEREWMLLPAGADLYSGVSGIALFLAYLGSMTGIAKYTTLAQAACRSVQAQVREMHGSLRMVGGYNGWGGIIYLYTHLGVLWQDRDLLHEAEELVKLLPDLVAQDCVLDVIGGSSGCIACLLSLYRVLPSAHILEVALQCGAHLLVRAAQCGGNPCTETSDMVISASNPLTGFSHGAAGMALSLLKLAAVSGQDRFRAGAVAAMAYERSVFSPKWQNWPDFRDHAASKGVQENVPARGKTHAMVTWCHGAPGIGLGRLASLSYLDDELMRKEISVALQTTLTQGFGKNHSLCHGDLGNLETVLAAARMPGNATYQRHSERLTAIILASIETQGWLTGIPLGVETPGLMTGIAGIGYELLRLAEPERVPSVLLLEPPCRRHP